MIPEKIDYITRKSRLSAGKFHQGEPSTYTIHSTANAKSTAQNERDNLENNDGSASFHSVVDEKQVVRCIPFDQRAWHAGDSTKAGGGNMTSLSLEICESGDREKTLQNAIAVVAHDLMELGWGVDRIRQHFDWTRKNCPRILRDTGKWDWFVESVEKMVKNGGKESEGVEEVPEMIYNYVDKNMPEWAREAVQWQVDNGILVGDGNGLHLTDNDLRTICREYRMHKKHEQDLREAVEEIVRRLKE